MIRRVLGLASDRAGGALVEFTVVFPVLLLIMVGIIHFGLILNNYIMLTDATAAGARQFSISRQNNTAYTDTVNQIYASASTLDQAKIKITLSVNGTVCSSDAACSNALLTAATKPASVAATYPCVDSFSGAFGFATTCTLQSALTELVQ